MIELRYDLAWRRDLGEELFLSPAPLPFLVEDRLAEFDTLAADVHVPWSFDQRTDIAITLTAERTEGVLLRGATASRACQIPAGGHSFSFPSRGS
jgi:hypothetical protein